MEKVRVKPTAILSKSVKRTILSDAAAGGANVERRELLGLIGEEIQRLEETAITVCASCNRAGELVGRCVVCGKPMCAGPECSQVVCANEKCRKTVCAGDRELVRETAEGRREYLCVPCYNEEGRRMAVVALVVLILVIVAAGVVWIWAH